jgi:hypothetical protein
MGNSSQSQDLEHSGPTPNPPDPRKRNIPDPLQPSAQGELDREAEPAPDEQVDDGSKLFPPGTNTPARRS